MSQSLFTSQVPSSPDINDGGPITVGTTVTFSATGSVSGARFYAPLTPGSSIFEATFWRVNTDDSTNSGTGTLLANAVYGSVTGGTWNSISFSSAVSVDTTHVYVVAIRTTQGRYVSTNGFFASSALVNGSITGLKDGVAAGGFSKLYDGRYVTDTTSYPNQTFGSSCYFADVLFDPTSSTVDLAATFTGTGSLTAGLTVQKNLAATLTGTGSLTAGLTAEKNLAASLTGTGSLTAGMAVQTNLAATLTATGSMSVSARVETTLAATLSAGGSMSAALTIPTIGPPDLIASPVASALLACLTEQMNELAKPPAKIELRAGAESGPLIGPNVDECCAGLAWVRVAQVYPSWDSFPGPDNTWLPCGPLAYAVVLEMGSAFCMPWSDSDDAFDNVDPPSTTDWLNAHTLLMQHQNLMRRAAACCFPATQRRAVGEWAPLSVEGGCLGGTLRVTVSVMNPCSDC